MRSSLLSLVFSAFVVSCGVHQPSFDEVARVSSPSGRVDAVLVEVNGGATTSFGYSVFVVPTGKLVSRGEPGIVSLYGAVRNQSAYGADLVWDEADRLTVEYLTARHCEITRDAVKIGSDEITVTVRSNINNTAAPPGGMLYNRVKNR
jgi:hypothetical protein